MRRIFKITLLLAAINAYGDGVDKIDSNVQPDGAPDVYREFSIGKAKLYLQELHPHHENVMPFYWKALPGSLVRPAGPNYWYYFDRNPCRGDYARVWDGVPEVSNICNYSNFVENTDIKRSVSEPKPVLLLLAAFIALLGYFWASNTKLR